MGNRQNNLDKSQVYVRVFETLGWFVCSNVSDFFVNQLVALCRCVVGRTE